MPIPNQSNPVEDGIWIEPVELTPDDATSDVNQIPPNCQVVSVGDNVNGDGDYLILPSLADVPAGHTITLLGVGTEDYELASGASGDKINTVDCGAGAHLQLISTDIVKLVKISSTAGWTAQAWTKLGADRGVITVTASFSPSISPSLSPSISPSKSPSLSPSFSDSLSPSLSQSKSPSLSPSVSPTTSPSISPSASPTTSPSVSPTTSASKSPSLSPSISPSLSPTTSLSPSISPSVSPT